MSAASHTTPATRAATLLRECAAALDDEIQSVMDDLVRWGGDRPVRVRAGAYEGAEGDQHVYTMRIDRPVRPPEFTAVEVAVGQKAVRGYVEEVLEDGHVLGLLTDDPIPGRLDEATIQFDPTSILRKTKGRLEEVEALGMPSHLAWKTLGVVPSQTGVAPVSHPSIARRGLNAGQVAAMTTAVGSELALIFGPPGTGKTRVLGCLVAELADTRQRRVLVTAHTNTALDTALASVVDAIPAEWVQEGRVVRMGKHTRDFRHLGLGVKEVSKRQMRAVATELADQVATLEARLDAIAPASALSTLLAQVTRRRSVEGAEDRLATLAGRADAAVSAHPEDAAVAVVAAEIRRLRQQRLDMQRGVAHGARIVGATLSRLAVDPEQIGAFDVVVVDEASMASLPQVLVATLHATQQLVVLGDPCQIRPVVQARTALATARLKCSLFDQLALADPGLEDPRRPILTLQYRMAPAIAAVVSETFYAGRLETDRSAATRGQVATGPAVLLVDTSRTGVTSAQRGSSRVNEGHAALVIDLVRALRREGVMNVGVITPFAAQSQLHRQALSAAVPGFYRDGGFTRTIHRAQGGERDVVILDLVDAPPRLSSFLDARWNDDLPNLLCVAFSRPRTRLIVLAHAQSLRAKYSGHDALIMRLLERCYREGLYLPLDQLALPAHVLGGAVARGELAFDAVEGAGGFGRGDAVYHPEFGAGVFVTAVPAGPVRQAIVEFASGVRVLKGPQLEALTGVA